MRQGEMDREEAMMKSIRNVKAVTKTEGVV